MQPFEQDDKKKRVIFKGRELVVFLPRRFEMYGCLHVEEHVETLGIFDLVADGKPGGLMFPAMIHMEPSQVEEVTRGGDQFFKLTFLQGDKFMDTKVVKNPNLGYVIYREFLQLGRIPDFITYSTALSIFDKFSKVSGMKFYANHAITEAQWAYLYRNPDDITQQYRHSQQNKPPQLVPFRSIGELAESTISKLLGPYIDQTLDAALVNKSETTTEFQEIMRRVAKPV